MKKLNTFASCLAALCLTAAATALVPCDKQSECTSAKAKTVAQVQSIEKTCSTAAKQDCPIGEAARAYVAQVNDVMADMDSDMCPGGASVMALMAVLGENEEYKPMVAAFEQFMAEQMQQRPANAQINATSDCASKCSSSRAVAQVTGKNQCNSSKPVAQINATSDCASKCSSSKTVSQVVKTGECSSAKPVAQVTGSDEACAKTCTQTNTVSQITTTESCTKTCDSAKPVAQVTGKSQCSSSKPVAQVTSSDCASKCSGSKAVAQITGDKSQCSSGKAVAQMTGDSQCSTGTKARFVAFGCDNCDQIARVAARSYMNMLIELKKVAGVEGCPMDVANKTLAAVAADLQSEMAATAKTDDADVVAVSMGAVSEKKADGCCPSNKK